MISRGVWKAPDGRTHENWGGELACPDLFNDLNACREFELQLIGLLVDSKGRKFILDGYHEYVANLWRVVSSQPPDAYFHWNDLGSNLMVVSASAEQRCEALSITLALW